MRRGGCALVDKAHARGGVDVVSTLDCASWGVSCASAHS